MNEGFKKALWIAIPAAFATGITLIPGPAIEIQFISYGILALIAMAGIWATNARKHRIEREEAEEKRRIEREEAEEKRVEEERQAIVEVRELLKQNTIMTCRMAIYNEHFSIDEKISAYITYRNQGQNHHTKTYMDKLVDCDIDEYIERHGITG